MDRDETVVLALDYAMPMLRNLAHKCNVDVEDLRQASAVDALASFDQAMAARNPRAYMQTVIKHAAVDYISTCRYEISLDKPLTEESDTTLSDMLAAPADVPQDYTELDARCAILHTALKKLPLEEQMYIREVYDLNAFNPVPRWDRKPNYHRSRKTMSKMALRRLRADQELKASIMEVQ